jgi:hypothetical protein
VTQNEWIMSAMKKRPITALDAFKGCGCLRLAARVSELRDTGIQIETNMTRTKTGKMIAAYTLKGKK